MPAAGSLEVSNFLVLVILGGRGGLELSLGLVGSLGLVSDGIHMDVTPTAPECSTMGLGLGFDVLVVGFLSLEKLGTGDGRVALCGRGGLAISMSVEDLVSLEFVLMEESLLDEEDVPS